MNSRMLLLILMLDALVARYVSGSAWHFLMVLAVTGTLELAGLWRPAPRWIVAMALPVAGSVALSGWLAFQKGLVSISFSPLPWSFHVALGIHLWAWIVSRWGGEEKESAWPAWMVFLAGVTVARIPAVEEIYGAAPWMVRILGMAVLVVGVAAAFARWEGQDGGRGSGAANAARSASRGRRIGARLLGMAAAAMLLTALLSPARSLAAMLYAWYGDRDEVTRLESFAGREAAVVSGAGMADGAGRRLPPEADIRLNPAVRFFVEWDNDEIFAKIMRRPLYVRAMTLPVFVSDSELAPLRRGEWKYDSDDGQEDGQIRLIDSGPQKGGGDDSGDGFPHTILMDRQDMRALPLVVSAERVDLDACYEFAGDWYQLALEDAQDRVSFSARSRELRLEDLEGRFPLRTGTLGEAEYLEIPGSPLVERVRDWLARNGISRGTGSLEETLIAVRELLAEQCAYRLRFTNPEGRSPIDNFLFGERAGHCELFASATVLILRTLGVPSRVAYGFSGGVARPQSRILAFRESDFHAWAEIFLDESGWVIFDTSPPARAAARPPARSGAGTAFAGFDRKAYENLSREIAPVAVGRKWLRDALAALLRWMAEFIVWICAALVATGFLIGLCKNSKLRKVEGAGSAEVWRGRRGGEGRPPGFLSEYLRTCAEIGRPKSVGETLLEFLDAMKRNGLCQGEFDEMIRYVYRVRYEGGPRDAAAEKRFREVVRDFRKRAGRGNHPGMADL